MTQESTLMREMGLNHNHCQMLLSIELKFQRGNLGPMMDPGVERLQKVHNLGRNALNNSVPSFREVKPGQVQTNTVHHLSVTSRKLPQVAINLQINPAAKKTLPIIHHLMLINLKSTSISCNFFFFF